MLPPPSITGTLLWQVLRVRRPRPLWLLLHVRRWYLWLLLCWIREGPLEARVRWKHGLRQAGLGLGVVLDARCSRQQPMPLRLAGEPTFRTDHLLLNPAF